MLFIFLLMLIHFLLMLINFLLMLINVCLMLFFLMPLPYSRGVQGGKQLRVR